MPPGAPQAATPAKAEAPAEGGSGATEEGQEPLGAGAAEGTALEGEEAAPAGEGGAAAGMPYSAPVAAAAAVKDATVNAAAAAVGKAGEALQVLALSDCLTESFSCSAPNYPWQ